MGIYIVIPFMGKIDIMLVLLAKINDYIQVRIAVLGSKLTRFPVIRSTKSISSPFSDTIQQI